MGTATRVCVDNYEAYPGIFRVSFDSGDVRAAVVLTRPQLEQLRSCVTDSLAHDDAVRRRRGGDLRRLAPSITEYAFDHADRRLRARRDEAPGRALPSALQTHHVWRGG